MSDILKKPVHLVLLKDTLLQKLKLEKTEVSVATPEKQPLPKEEKKTNTINYNIPKVNNNLMKQAQIRMRLPIAYEQLKPNFTEDPPCDTCVSFCCKAFVVSITPEEYDSGLFGEYAIKLTPEIQQQFRGFAGRSLGVTLPQLLLEDGETRHFLEGKIGEACPFLVENRCSIYENRPLTCRNYTCLDDPRVTDDMRSGKVDSMAMVANMFDEGDE